MAAGDNLAPAAARYDDQALRELLALAASDGHAATFDSLRTYRTALLVQLSGCAGQAAREVAALLASDAYAISFQTLQSYRGALRETLSAHIKPLAYIHMENFIASLYAADDPIQTQAADLIESLQKRITQQQSIMDKCASTLVEAITTEDGIDSTQAEACVSAIRESFAPIGKTTTEQMLETLYDRIGAAAGLPPHTEFSPVHVIDQMRACIAAQSKNGGYLDFLLPMLFWQTPDDMMRLRLSPPGQPERYMTFPDGTSWVEALDAAMALPQEAQTA